VQRHVRAGLEPAQPAGRAPARSGLGNWCVVVQNSANWVNGMVVHVKVVVDPSS
jgi:hypothetical protein